MTKLEDIREIVAKRATGETFHSVAKMSDEHVVELFNDLLEDKPYWFCPDCEQFHSKEQLHCSLPCTVNDIEHAVTEEEYEDLYDKFDPDDYAQDEDHLQFPHTKFASWMNNSQTIYNRKINHHAGQKLEQAAIAWKCKHDGRLEININDYQEPMNRFEQALRKFEIKRFNGWQQSGAGKTLDELCEWAIQTAPSK